MHQWQWTDHIKLQMSARNISKALVDLALNEPDEIVTGIHNREIYQKVIGQKLLRVITQDKKLITVYFTDKIDKYMKEGK